MTKLKHILFHLGAAALSVGAVATPFIPFPYNLVAVGAISLTQGYVGTHVPITPPSVKSPSPSPAPAARKK